MFSKPVELLLRTGDFLDTWLDLDPVWRVVPCDPIYVTYVIIVLTALAVVYCASVSTLQRPAGALDPDPRNTALFHPDDLETPSSMDRVSASDAAKMPVLGALTLVSMFLALKYLSRDTIHLVMRWYFALTSTVSLAATLSQLVRFGARKCGVFLPRYKVSVHLETYDSFRATKCPQTSTDSLYVHPETLLTLAVAGTVAAGYSVTSQWVLGNILGASVAVAGIQLIRLDSFQTAFVALAGLFVYDVYFVFGTTMMVSVATQLDIPIKLEIPRPPSPAYSKPTAMAMLGLGDILVPALVISLCLRYDCWKYYTAHARLPFHLARPFPTPYFHATLGAYVAGLSATILFMHWFQTGQPALLYLCPSLALAILSVSLVSADQTLWTYFEKDTKSHTD